MAETPQLLVDGEPATPADLTHQALVNYGAYTSFRVEAGAVRGLDLHLARLETSAIELFGEAVGEDRLRGLMRSAFGDRDACWLRISLFSPEITHRAVDWRGAPRVMIGVFDPPPPLATAPRVRTVVHVREAAHLKHAATFGLVRARRAARDAGFDDALFVDAQGLISEGSLWNVGFLSGERVVWPRAPMLAGVGQALVHAGLSAVGMTGECRPVSIAELDAFDGAFLCNSATPACAIAAVDGREFPDDPARLARLVEAWAKNSPQPV